MKPDKPSRKSTVNSAFAGLSVRPDLVGKRYVSLLRCSDLTQSDTSPDGQKEVNDTYSAIQQMHWAGYDVYAEGVSGSQTFNREDIEELLHLKRTRNDFDVVVVFELSRATRGGIRHGNVVEDKLKKAGIELVSSTELIPNGAIGDLIKAVKHFSNQQTAYNISKSVARGLGQSLAKSSRPAAGRTNYGMDRLYLGPDSTPRTLIRWEGLVQLRLDPVTKAVLGRSVRPPIRNTRKKGQRNLQRERYQRFIGYRKQEDEISVLVPGADHARNAVISMWRMYYIENIGAHRIIQWLRKNNIAAPFGGDWCLHSVHVILWNPIYLGIEVRHRWSKGLYHIIGPDGPIPVTIDQDELEKNECVTVPTTERPRNEWQLVDKPRLMDFLPKDVRQAAMGHIQAMYDEDAVAAKQAKHQKRKNKSLDNPYVLGHIARSKQTKHLMRGDSNVKKVDGQRVIRRYYFDYSAASKALSGVCARRVPAQMLEDAVVPAVFSALMDRELVSECVRKYMTTTEKPTRNLEEERYALVKEQEDTVRRVKRVHKTSKGLSDEDLEAINAEDNARLIGIRRELAQLATVVEDHPVTPDQAVAAAIERVMTLPQHWRSLPNAEVKKFLAAVVEELVIDLETLEVTLTVRLPNAATIPLDAAAKDDKGRVNFLSAWSLEHDSTRRNPIIIAHFRCQTLKQGFTSTCNCRRRAA